MGFLPTGKKNRARRRRHSKSANSHGVVGFGDPGPSSGESALCTKGACQKGLEGVGEGKADLFLLEVLNRVKGDRGWRGIMR